jgi:hypothetical protein
MKGQWLATRTGRFSPGEKVSETHWIRGMVATEPVWILWKGEKYLLYAEN